MTSKRVSKHLPQLTGLDGSKREDGEPVDSDAKKMM